MTAILLLAVVGLSIAQMVLPRRYAFAPLLLSACQLGNVEVLPELTPVRLILVLGLTRALCTGLLKPRVRSQLDTYFIALVALLLLSTIGHSADQWTSSPLNARLGLSLNIAGSYLYGRAYLPDMAAFKRYALLLPVFLLPLAAGMLMEMKTRRNYYTAVSAASGQAAARDDRVRARGPFGHPILAGTAGATALPFAFLLWQTRRRRAAALAFGTCLMVAYTSSSSGPLAALGVTFAAMAFWRWRHKTRLAIWGMLGFGLFYVLVSGRGPWYLMASIDLVGGSTGWHRAYLMDQGYRYLGEWWLWGTDYTRHWMPTGVRWNPNMVDITNYYLHLGVMGGLPVMLTLMTIILASWRLLFKRMNEMRASGNADEFALWCAAVSLAAHAISFFSISYFDQMYVFFYVLIGALPGLVAATAPDNSRREFRLEPEYAVRSQG